MQVNEFTNISENLVLANFLDLQYMYHYHLDGVDYLLLPV